MSFFIFLAMSQNGWWKISFHICVELAIKSALKTAQIKAIWIYTCYRGANISSHQMAHLAFLANFYHNEKIRNFICVNFAPLANL